MAATETPNKAYPCPGCKCVFFTTKDLKTHRATFNPGKHEEEFKTLHKQIEHDEDIEDPQGDWYPSKYGDGAFLKLVEKDLDLANKIRQNGPLTMGRYMYKVQGKWIIKTPT